MFLKDMQKQSRRSMMNPFCLAQENVTLVELDDEKSGDDDMISNYSEGFHSFLDSLSPFPHKNSFAELKKSVKKSGDSQKKSLAQIQELLSKRSSLL